MEFAVGAPEQISAAYSLASILMLVAAALLSFALVAGTIVICTRWREKHLIRLQRRLSTFDGSSRRPTISSVQSGAATNGTRSRTGTTNSTNWAPKTPLINNLQQQFVATGEELNKKGLVPQTSTNPYAALLVNKSEQKQLKQQHLIAEEVEGVEEDEYKICGVHHQGGNILIEGPVWKSILKTSSAQSDESNSEESSPCSHHFNCQHPIPTKRSFTEWYV